MCRSAPQNVGHVFRIIMRTCIPASRNGVPCPWRLASATVHKCCRSPVWTSNLAQIYETMHSSPCPLINTRRRVYKKEPNNEQDRFSFSLSLHLSWLSFSFLSPCPLLKSWLHRRMGILNIPPRIFLMWQMLPGHREETVRSQLSTKPAQSKLSQQGGNSRKRTFREKGMHLRKIICGLVLDFL